MIPPTMHAAEYDSYGDPDVLTVRSVPTPQPGAGELLVRVHGASVNPADALVRSGGMRVATGRRFPKRVGADFAGEVAALGAGVDRLAVGQRVWGYLGGLNAGTAAEYVIAKQTWASRAPADVDLVTAAALPTVAMASLQALRDAAHLTRGERLLVIGASGGLGTAAIQLGRTLGAHVTAVASVANAGLCRELGADDVLDYATVAPGELGREYDVILDAHGTRLREYRRTLRRGGRMVTLAATDAGSILFAMLSTALPGPRVRIFTLLTRRRRNDLELLADRVDAGTLRPVIDSIYPLAAIADAHRAVQSGHARGKRVIRVLGATAAVDATQTV